MDVTVTKTLFNVAIWDEEVGEDPVVHGYAVVAKDSSEAEEIAMQKHLDENGVTENAKVDDELTYEISCAPDKDGNLFMVQIVKQSE